MKVWIFQTGEPLQSDGDSVRPMRAINLSNALIERGHKVVIWSSGFFHQEKRQRCLEFKSIVINGQLTINLVPSRGYKRNIGIGRLIDHAQLAMNLSKILESGEFSAPDFAFVGYPPIEGAAVMLTWLRKERVPSMIDVKDQWPAIFLEPFPKFLRPLIKLSLAPYYYLGRRALSSASAFTTMSDGYLNWMSKFSGRKLGGFDRVTPLTAPQPDHSVESLRDAERWWIERGVSTSNNRRFCFVGSFMSVFDFSLIREAAERLQAEGVECQIVICGDGGFGEDIRAMMDGLPNVVFPGWIDSPKISVLAKCCAGSLIPYKNIENFIMNTPNKVIDALSHGLPIITTLTGEVERLVEENGVGFACNDNTGRKVYEAMKLLLDNPSLTKAMSERGLTLYNSKFAYDSVYGGLVDSIEKLVDSEKR